MKRIETGRTLLETLAVLALIGLLSISGMLGYSFLHVYFQKQEFVKEIDRLAISYAATPVKPQNDGRVAIKAIYPSAQRLSPTEMVLPGGGKAEIIVLNETASEFAVVTSGVDPDMCEEYLRNGSYKAVRYPERIKGNGNDRDREPSIVGKDSVKNGIDGISTREFIESICGTRGGPGVGPALYYGGCPQQGWSYWHTDGECHRCAFGTTEDRYGVCCSTDAQKRNYAGCGVCNCPGQTVCDSASHQCVECVVDNDCKDPNDPSKLKHEGKPRCDRTNHVCVECLDEGDCNAPGETCRRACDSVTHTCGEGCKVNSWWQRLNGQCVCRNLISMGNECPLDTTCGPGDCCSGTLSCQDIGGTGRCCPTEEKTCPAGSCCESVAVGGCPHARLEYGEFTQVDSQELDTVACVCRTQKYYHCAKTGEYYLGGTLSADKHIVTGGTLQASAPVVSPSCVVPAAPQACNPATQCCADPVTDVCGRSGYETVTAKSKLTSWILKDNVRCVSTEIEYCPGDGTTANSCTCPSKPKDATCSTATGKACTSGANTEACDCPCDTGLECVDGKCSESCLASLVYYENGEKKCCPTSTQLYTENGENKCCPYSSLIYLENNVKKCCPTSTQLYTENGENKCCPASNRIYTEDGVKKCCSKDLVNGVCPGCLASLVYYENGEEKCCPTSTQLYTENGENKCCPYSSLIYLENNVKKCCPTSTQLYTENGENKCCPASNRIYTEDGVKKCCSKDLVNGVCPGECPNPLPTYNQACTIDCGCDGTELTCTDNVCKCPPGTEWNPSSGKCEKAQCDVILYKNKYNKRKADQGANLGECCEPDRKLIKATANTLFKGYKAGETTLYGCCPANRVYTKTITSGGCSNFCGGGNTRTEEACCPEKNKVVSGECCTKNKIYTSNGVEKCCSGTIYANGTRCCPSGKYLSGNSCLCPPATQSCRVKGGVGKDGSARPFCNVKSYPGITYNVSATIVNTHLGSLGINQTCLTGATVGLYNGWMTCLPNSSGRDIRGTFSVGTTSSSSIPIEVYANHGGPYDITLTLTRQGQCTDGDD